MQTLRDCRQTIPEDFLNAFKELSDSDNVSWAEMAKDDIVIDFLLGIRDAD
jgi:hypothetical protein